MRKEDGDLNLQDFNLAALAKQGSKVIRNL